MLFLCVVPQADLGYMVATHERIARDMLSNQREKADPDPESHHFVTNHLLVQYCVMNFLTNPLRKKTHRFFHGFSLSSASTSAATIFFTVAGNSFFMFLHPQNKDAVGAHQPLLNV